jgi:4-hydroxy-3-polyprenylbenzoate decarboxylase
MAFTGLGQFVETLDRKGLLVRVKDFVDPVYEIAEITDRYCKQPNGGKAILFESTGTAFPVLTNAFGSDERLALALGFSSPSEVARELECLLFALTSPKQSLLDKFGMFTTLKNIAQWMPKSVSGRGECQQIIHRDPDLSLLPILKSWPFDGGRFITRPMVSTVDPYSGTRKIGRCRMQVFSSDMTGVHWPRHKAGSRHFEEYKKQGTQMPIAVVLGGDPAYNYAATAPLPDCVDEYLLAGFLRKKPVKLVKGITVDIEVPYDADIVIEGYVDPNEELIWEGPFGDHSGFYSMADWYPKFYITCITHKQNAIFHDTVVGVPPMEDGYLAKATERIFLSPIKIAILPEIQDLYIPEQGVNNSIAIVKIKKSFPGQAHKVANALWGVGQMMFNKVLVVVSSDVDIRNPKKLGGVLALHFSSRTDYFIGRGPLDVLDHSSERPGFGGKILFDLTEKLPEEKSSVQDRVGELDSEKVAELLSNKYLLLSDFNTSLLASGIPILLLSVDKEKSIDVWSLSSKVIKVLSGYAPQIIVIVDKEISIKDTYLLIWYASGNTDPARDCFLIEQNEGMTTLVVDGTRKSFPIDKFPRNWPNVVAASSETIRQVDAKWEKLGLGPLISSPSAHFSNMQFGNGAILK